LELPYLTYYERRYVWGITFYADMQELQVQQILWWRLYVQAI